MNPRKRRGSRSAEGGRRLTFTVDRDSRGARLGSFLAARLGEGTSQRAIKRALERGACQVNGKPERFASRRLERGDTVVLLQEAAERSPQRLEIDPARVLYSDADLLAYDKPAGTPSTATDGKGGAPDLHQALLAHLRQQNPDAVLEPVHRLDRDTSGVLLFARSPRARGALDRQFRGREVSKTYIALVRGALRPGEGRWDTTLVRGDQVGGVGRWRIGRGEEGKRAITEWEVGERLGEVATLVSLRPLTGRTHQLRVHLAAAGHPILGDLLYGGGKGTGAHGVDYLPPRQLLHASLLAIDDLHGDGRLEIRAPLPADFVDALRALRQAADGGSRGG